MVADIHTKAYPETRAAEWKSVRCNAGIFSEEEFKARIGTAGLGWFNRNDIPGKYVTRKTGGDEPENEANFGETACAAFVERDAHRPLWTRLDGKPVSIAADCAGVGS